MSGKYGSENRKEKKKNLKWYFLMDIRRSWFV